MADMEIRFGILGCANIARKVSRAIIKAPGARLYAIASRSLSKAQDFASENNFPSDAKIYGSYAQLIDDENVDAVYMPLPTGLHLEWVPKVAAKGKHILLEKPPAECLKDLDVMLDAIEKNGLQYMDGTMWMHHPRTEHMRNLLQDNVLFGELKEIHSVVCFNANSISPLFLTENIRVKPGLDSLGVLGDLGWYCMRAFLWAANYELPHSVRATPGTEMNSAGIILSCGATLTWHDGKTAMFTCSFTTHVTSRLVFQGTNATIQVDDFAIPFRDDVAQVTVLSQGQFDELGWRLKEDKLDVKNEIPQEALMVAEFAKLVKRIKNGGQSERKWVEWSRKTQLIVDAVKTSIQDGFRDIILDEFLLS